MAAAPSASGEKPLKLQVVRLPGRSKHVFTSISPSLPVSSFQQLLAAQFQVPVPLQALFVAGVPPRPISTADGNLSLSFLGIKPGDSIELREVDDAAPSEMRQGKAGSWEHISFIPAGSGRFFRKEMPRDNSCLFHAIAFLCGNSVKGNGGNANAQSMRELAANIVASDPAKWNTATLASPNALYQQHILTPSTWGGGIELAIFSQHFQMEILAFDLLHLREDAFGSDQNYGKRVFLIYTGDHCQWALNSFQPPRLTNVCSHCSLPLWL
jgi:ubiquitin thioesterase OTU1